MPSGWATIEPNRTPLVTRSARASLPLAQASAIAAARIACRSAVISRASSSTRPAPISAIVCRSLENDGSVESNCALSKPSETNTLATSSAGAADDRIVVAAEAGIGIRPAGAAERRIDAVLALGRDDRLRRLRPPGAVDGGEFRLEQLAPALDERGQRRRARRGDLIEIEMRAGREDALVPTRARMRRRRRDWPTRPTRKPLPGFVSCPSRHIRRAWPLDVADRYPPSCHDLGSGCKSELCQSAAAVKI